MKTVISAKLKPNTTLEQFAQLHATQLAYHDDCNFVSMQTIEYDKMSLQNRADDKVRTHFYLPSQVACSIPHQVRATQRFVNLTEEERSRTPS
jgi:putative transposase